MDSACNRNQHQESSWKVKRSRCLRMTTSPPSLCQLSKKCGSLDVLQPFGHPWPVTETALPLLPHCIKPCVTHSLVFLPRRLLGGGGGVNVSSGFTKTLTSITFSPKRAPSCERFLWPQPVLKVYNYKCSWENLFDDHSTRVSCINRVSISHRFCFLLHI
jgi:hypothetical protein